MVFEGKPDIEKFTNLSRIIIDCKIIRQEREAVASDRLRFENNRNAVLDQRGQERRQELAETKRHLNAMEGFPGSLKQALKPMLPEAAYQSIEQVMNRAGSSPPQTG